MRSGGLTRRSVAAMVTLCTCTMPSALWARPAFKCHSRLKPRNVLVGTLGKYEVSKGLAVIKREGFINRRRHRVRRKCLITGIKAGECVVMHFDRAAFRRAVTKNRKREASRRGCRGSYRGGE